MNSAAVLSPRTMHAESTFLIFPHNTHIAETLMWTFKVGRVNEEDQFLTGSQSREANTPV